MGAPAGVPGAEDEAELGLDFTPAAVVGEDGSGGDVVRDAFAAFCFGAGDLFGFGDGEDRDGRGSCFTRGMSVMDIGGELDGALFAGTDAVAGAGT